MIKKFKYSIFLRPESKLLYIRMFGKKISTGLSDTEANRKLIEKIALNRYQEYLKNNGVYSKPQIILRIRELADEYAKTLKQINSKRSFLYSMKKLDYEENYPISIENLKKKIKKMKSLNYSPVTVNTVLRRLRAFLNSLHEDGILPEVISLKREFEKEPQTENNAYSDKEIELILVKAKKKDKEFYLLILFLRYTGFRIGESLTLTNDCFDFNRMIIMVPNKINKKNIQKFPITEIVEKIYHEVEILRNNGKTFSDNRFFRWSIESVSRLLTWLRAIENELGIKVSRRGFHGFRRSFADSMFDKGLKIDVIKELMRHSDINITFDFYKSYQQTKLSGELSELQGSIEI